MKPYETLKVCGSEYHFKLTTANAVKLEEEIGTDLLSGLEKLAQVKIIAQYYYYAGKSMNDSIGSIDDVYTLFDDFITDGGSYDDLQRFVVEIMYTSGILSQQMYDTTKKIERKQQEALQKFVN